MVIAGMTAETMIFFFMAGLFLHPIRSAFTLTSELTAADRRPARSSYLSRFARCVCRSFFASCRAGGQSADDCQSVHPPRSSDVCESKIEQDSPVRPRRTDGLLAQVYFTA